MKKQNNIVKKLVLIPLTLVMLMSSLMLGFNSVTAKAQTNEVGLYSADTSMIDAAAGFTVYRLFAEIKVQNIAYEKKVTLHYRDDDQEEWRDCEASYLRSLDGKGEVWRAEPSFSGKFIEYAIKYEVNGVTYWDNNEGKNYKTFKNGTTKI